MKKLQAFLTGAYEFRLGFTTSYAAYDLQDSYDWGREWAHRLTLRAFEN